jgi:hypothetical protein
VSGQRVVRVSAQLIVRVLTVGEAIGPAIVLAGLPAGARYVRCYDSPDVYADMCLVFEHEDWPALDHGGRIPELRPVLETVRS